MNSIRTRFLILSFAIIALALTATGFMFSYLFELGIKNRVDAELVNLGNQIASQLEFDADGAIKAPTGLSDTRFNAAYGGLYWQIDDPDNGDQLRSRSLWDFTLALPEDTHDAGTIHRYDLDGPEGSKLYAQERSLIVATPTGARDIRICIAIDKASLVSATSDFVKNLIPYLLVLGALLLATSAIQLTFGLKPLIKLSEDVDKIQEHPNQRLNVEYPTEVAPLVVAVNSLLSNREKTIEKSRSRAADLAHGLKTPLTVLANNAGKLKDLGKTEIASEISAMVQVMQSHIDHELARSRISPAPEHRSSDANLGEVIGALTRTLEKTPKGSGIKWTVNGYADFDVKIDPNDLRELAGNILENAVKWSKDEVITTISRSGNFAEITVEDDGPGIDPAQIQQMTDRGMRFDEKTPGTGIGLAIVHDIVEVYGLKMSIQNRQSNGLSIKLLLPTTEKGAARTA